ncbi:DUF7344 domain-containing protein [Halostella litorea]|uniref:DUF7344 domain-containing protein n=1 Tax=Halostella litorea TaxID=2528831 RepID=UPI001386C2B9|nr:hypothetical protein [Halostella litorea]
MTTVAAICDALRAPRRQHTVRILDVAEPLPVADLASRVAEREVGPVHEPSPDERRDVYVDLVHRHLPKLHAAALLTCDDRRLYATARTTDAIRLLNVATALFGDRPRRTER